MLHAVIGIGSNSTRLLVGDILDGKMTPRERMREGTRLFSGLEDGMLSAQSMMRTMDAVVRFAGRAREMRVASLHVFATSAARDAKNGEDLAALVKDMMGTRLEILSGEEEALLSLEGVTAGARSGMVDIGGGSTELAVSWDGGPAWTASVQVGAARLLAEVPLLSGDGFDRALAIARERTAEAGKMMPAAIAPKLWYGVGGTLTCLASVDMRLPAFDREAVNGRGLERSTVENWARRLAKMRAVERAALPGMQAQRADIIAHGVIALLAVMEALGMERITVSNRSNLDGYLIRMAGGAGRDDTIAGVKSFYEASVQTEWDRLSEHFFEFEINKHFIDRYIRPGDRVLDVGGGPGRYSLHLARRGADVTLFDLSEGNVAFAAEMAEQMDVPLKTVCADARFADEKTHGQFDAILLMGPLYHLLREEDREMAVRACLRRLKPGGVLFAAFISIYGGMIYAAREIPESILWEGEDAFYNRIRDKRDFAGPGFTHAFMIHPSHVQPFMRRFPLETLHLAGSESIAAPFHNKLKEQPPEVIAGWLDFAMSLCEREETLSYSEHLLYIGRKQ